MTIILLAVLFLGILTYQFVVVTENYELRRLEEVQTRAESLALNQRALVNSSLQEINRSLEIIADVIEGDEAFAITPQGDLSRAPSASGYAETQALTLLRIFETRNSPTTNFLLMSSEGRIAYWDGENDAPQELARDMLDRHRESGTEGSLLSEPVNASDQPASRIAAVSHEVLGESEGDDGEVINELQWIVLAVIDTEGLGEAVYTSAELEGRSLSMVSREGNPYFRRPKVDNTAEVVFEGIEGYRDGEPVLTSSIEVSPFDDRRRMTAAVGSEHWPIIVRATEDLQPTMEDISRFRRVELIRSVAMGTALLLLLGGLVVLERQQLRAAKLLVRSEERMREMAQHDSLTGLANRLLLTDRLNQAIQLAQRNRNKVALLYIDLNNFKPINDSYGHATGDEVLKATAARLEETVRSSDTVGRIGGDEFLVLLPTIDDSQAAITVGNKIIEATEQPVHFEGKRYTVSASIGVAIFPEHGHTAEELLHVSDQAMYHAKRTGAGTSLAETPGHNSDSETPAED